MSKELDDLLIIFAKEAKEALAEEKDLTPQTALIAAAIQVAFPSPMTTMDISSWLHRLANEFETVERNES